MLNPGYLSKKTSEAPEHINVCANFLCPSMMYVSCISLWFLCPVFLLSEISDAVHGRTHFPCAENHFEGIFYMHCLYWKEHVDLNLHRHVGTCLWWKSAGLCHWVETWCIENTLMWDWSSVELLASSCGAPCAGHCLWQESRLDGLIGNGKSERCSLLPAAS